MVQFFREAHSSHLSTFFCLIASFEPHLKAGKAICLVTQQTPVGYKKTKMDFWDFQNQAFFLSPHRFTVFFLFLRRTIFLKWRLQIKKSSAHPPLHFLAPYTGYFTPPKKQPRLVVNILLTILKGITYTQTINKMRAVVAALLVSCVSASIIPQGDTYIYLAPSSTPGVAVPHRNVSLVAFYEPLTTVPVGWEQVPVRADYAKYVVRGHAHDLPELQAAYGEDLVRVPGTTEFFVLATDEIEVRKAHSCGSMLLRPQEDVPLKGAERVPTTVGVTDADKVDALTLITEDGVENILRKLSGAEPVTIDGKEVTIPTRYSFGEWNLVFAEWAGDWLKEAAGCDDIIYQNFTVTKLFKKQTSRNVICVRKGTEEPDQVVVIGAHFDSISSSNGGNSEEFAPGAIDNGSGSSSVLIAATALRSFRFRKTVHFILFSGEEQGLYGSTHYVAAAKEAGNHEKIDAALIMDMTAYSSKYFGVIIEGSTDPAIKALMKNAEENLNFLKAQKALGSRMTIEHHDNSFGSDHVPFQTAGIPAILHIEQDDTNYFGYHKTTDVCDNANYEQMRDIARVITGQLMDYSGAYLPSSVPEM